MNCRYLLDDSISGSEMLIKSSRFIFGGLSSKNSGQPVTASFTDIYLLSIPSFSWIRLNDSTTQMRAAHQCEVIGNRQMLVIGGYDPSNKILGNLPDSFYNGLGVFDMSNLSWSNQYDHLAPEYVRPGLIDDYYAQKYDMCRSPCCY